MLFKILSLSGESLIAFVLSLLGLIWQVYEISKIYFAYGTRVDLQIEIPRNISMPGLTVCVILKDINGDQNSENLFYLPIKQIMNQSIATANVTCEAPAPELLGIVNSKSLIACDEVVKPKIFLHHFNGNKIGQCKTYFHRRWNETAYEVYTANAKDFYQLTISPVSNSSVYFFVHNPTIAIHISEADTISMNLSQIQEMVLSTTKSTTHFLPPPYRTMCRSYNEIEYGQWGCVFNCRQEKMKSKGICRVWPRRVPAPIDSDRSFNIKKRAQCIYDRLDQDCFENVCHQRQCDGEWYTTTTIYIRDRSEPYSKSRIFIRRPFGVEFTYVYFQNLARIEYICYVASCFGIWFGVSFADCLRYLFISIKLKLVKRQKSQTYNRNFEPVNRLSLMKQKSDRLVVPSTYHYRKTFYGCS